MWQFIGFSHLFIGKIVMLLLFRKNDNKAEEAGDRRYFLRKVNKSKI